MLDLIKKLPSTGLSKAIIEDESASIIRQIEEGTIDPLKAMIVAKAMEDVVKKVLSYTRDTAIANAEQYKNEPIYGATLQVRNTPATYDFEADTEYLQLKNQLKDREAILKEAIKSKSRKALTEEGEVVEAPPIKSPGSQTIAITFNKK